jgi:hypothetical protein
MWAFISLSSRPMKWINAGDIRTWIVGKQRHCSETLPELIRRLIFATAGDITEIDFPSGDSIAIGEWDGRLNTPVVSPFFPTGISGWEISTKTAPGGKANDDYQKRTTDPRGLKPSESSFVFVTPRAWKGRMLAEPEERSWCLEGCTSDWTRCS